MTSRPSDRRTKADLLNALDDASNIIAGLEAALDEEAQRYRTQRGMVKKQGREIVELRRQAARDAKKIDALRRTNKRLAIHESAVDGLLWSVAGIDKRRYPTLGDPLPAMIGTARRIITENVQRRGVR